MQPLTRAYRLLPDALQPLVGVLYATAHPDRSAERYRWRAGRDPIADVARLLEMKNASAESAPPRLDASPVNVAEVPPTPLVPSTRTEDDRSPSR